MPLCDISTVQKTFRNVFKKFKQSRKQKSRNLNQPIRLMLANIHGYVEVGQHGQEE